VKLIEVGSLHGAIRNKLANPVARRVPPAESLADILEHDLDATIQNWMALVGHDEELTCVPLGFEDRRGHLPNLIAHLIYAYASRQRPKPTSRPPPANTAICDVNKPTPQLASL
jgi:hypothetical protein